MEKTVIEEIRKFNYLIGEIDAAYHEASQKLGLSDSAMQVLYIIRNHGEECSLTQICRLSGTSKQTINSALRKLEADGIVRLESLTGRRKKVCLTPQGKTLADNTVSRLIAIENDIFSSWSKQERELYLKLTQRYFVSI